MLNSPAKAERIERHEARIRGAGTKPVPSAFAISFAAFKKSQSSESLTDEETQTGNKKRQAAALDEGAAASTETAQHKAIQHHEPQPKRRKQTSGPRDDPNPDLKTSKAPRKKSTKAKEPRATKTKSIPVPAKVATTDAAVCEDADLMIQDVHSSNKTKSGSLAGRGAKRRKNSPAQEIDVQEQVPTAAAPEVIRAEPNDLGPIRKEETRDVSSKAEVVPTAKSAPRSRRRVAKNTPLSVGGHEIQITESKKDKVQVPSSRKEKHTSHTSPLQTTLSGSDEFVVDQAIAAPVETTIASSTSLSLQIQSNQPPSGTRTIPAESSAITRPKAKRKRKDADIAAPPVDEASIFKPRAICQTSKCGLSGLINESKSNKTPSEALADRHVNLPSPKKSKARKQATTQAEDNIDWLFDTSANKQKLTTQKPAKAMKATNKSKSTKSNAMVDEMDLDDLLSNIAQFGKKS